MTEPMDELRQASADLQPLSPAAQAVLEAFGAHPINSDCITSDLLHGALPAALCALADQVVPLPRLPYDSCCDVHAAAIRAEILAIAAELRQ